MLVFPGSPAYGLISLEQAQAKARGTGATGRCLSGEVKGKKEGLGGFVARMRLGSEDKMTNDSPVSPLILGSPAVGCPAQQDKAPGGSNTQTGAARTPVLRQRKSGFLKIFGGGDKSAAPPLPTSPVPRTPATMISSPMPVGMTDDGLPSPFIPGESNNRKPMVLRDIVGRQGSASSASPSPQMPITRQSSASSSSPPHSLQDRPSIASFASSSSRSFSRFKEGGLSGFEGSSSRLGDDLETGSRERSGTTSTVHGPRYDDLGPRNESIRSDLSTMGGGDEDAAMDRKMMLKLRHISATNFLSSLPSGYLSQPHADLKTGIAPSSASSSTLNNSIPSSSTSPSDYQFSTSSGSVSRPSVSASSDGPPATPSYNSLLSSSSSHWVSSSVYASSESSSSIAPSPLPVTPLSGTMAHQQQMSMMSLVSPTPTQSSFLSSPGRTPQQPPYVDIRNGSTDGGVSVSSVIANLQDELAATKKQMRQQVSEMERMRAELEAMKREKEEMKRMMMCRGCGSRDVAPRSNSSESAGDSRPAGVVNRPRAPTGPGGRFGNRMI
ncbi:hypothetical protein FRB90_012042 [Tulasnella sp. 427]|nr:hypothetical protein FRB90_012042 [Tulasnella sp. 427]